MARKFESLLSTINGRKRWVSEWMRAFNSERKDSRSEDESPETMRSMMRSVGVNGTEGSGEETKGEPLGTARGSTKGSPSESDKDSPLGTFNAGGGTTTMPFEDSKSEPMVSCRSSVWVRTAVPVRCPNERGRDSSAEKNIFFVIPENEMACAKR